MLASRTKELLAVSLLDILINSKVGINEWIGQDVYLIGDLRRNET